MRVFSFLLFLLIGISGFAQSQISGRITNRNGESVTGATVLVQGTGKGVVSKPDGSFQVNGLSDGNHQVKISFIGYETQIVEVELKKTAQLLVVLQPSNFFTEEVFVYATRAGKNDPVTYSTVTKEQIESQNAGQDMPYLLALTPSFVASSDAGTGVGYTSFRIRGTDANRINVTVNGVPVNDAESHGVFWVNMPDFASSVENVQVQRGVGNSTNGAAAFGASVNMQTNTLNPLPYARYNGAAGSFNTFKNTVQVGSGLLNNHFTVDARLSKISSDGFIDRAWSNLKSFYLSGGYYGDKSVVRVNIFSGEEHTFQAWNGVPSVRLNNDLEGMKRYGDHGLISEQQTQEMLASDSRTYNIYTYENETDNYQQDHYQILASHQFAPSLIANVGLHYTHGRGYYEQFKPNDKFSKYGLPNLMIGETELKRTDIIRQKWLENDFYGLTFSINKQSNKSDFTLGGAYNEYIGDHYGSFVWMRHAGETFHGDEWYQNTGEKTDFNMYGKYNYSIFEGLNAYADMQYRIINYSINGIDDDLRLITQSHEFNFFNPKLGVFYRPADGHETYLSWSIANREPNRSNYTDVPPGKELPVAEQVSDIELGYKLNTSKYVAGVNFYFMDYTNQLILTGELNDVGSAIMTNVESSYRAGIEIVAGAKLHKTLRWDVNATLSQNKISDFIEYVENWDTGTQDPFELGTTTIAFSPSVVMNSQIKYSPLSNLDATLITSFVGKQYIDNSANEDRKLNPYFVNHLNVAYFIKGLKCCEPRLSLQVNNLFNHQYESNAWIYNYILGGERFKMDGYYPQAGRNFMVGLDIRF